MDLILNSDWNSRTKQKWSSKFLLFYFLKKYNCNGFAILAGIQVQTTVGMSG